MRYFILVFFIVLIGACKKEPASLPDDGMYPYIGTVTMKVNEEEFPFLPVIVNNYRLSGHADIAFISFSEEGFERKSLSFSAIPINTEKHSLVKSNNQTVEIGEASYGTSLSDGDVAGNNYKLNDSDSIEDYFQFTSINEDTKEVRGIFQASFLVNKATAFDPSSPDTIIITDGVFETVLQER